MAQAQGRVRALAGAGKFRRAGTAANELERVESVSCPGQVKRAKRNEIRDPGALEAYIWPLGPGFPIFARAIASKTRVDALWTLARPGHESRSSGRAYPHHRRGRNDRQKAHRATRQ